MHLRALITIIVNAVNLIRNNNTLKQLYV